MTSEDKQQRSDESSALVKIQLRVKGQDEQEIIRSTTAKGIEIIEVNGTVFYRKRKPVVLVVEEEPSTKRQNAQPDSSPAQPHPLCNSEEAEAVPILRGSDDPEDAATTGPLPTMLPEPELAAPVDPLLALQQQLAACLPESCPKAIAMQFALEQLLTQGAAALDRSSPEDGTAAPCAYNLSVKKLLHSFAQLLQEQVDTASGLLLQVRPKSQLQSSIAGVLSNSETPASAVDAASSPSPAAGLSAPDDPLSLYLAMAPMIRDISQGSMLRGHLQCQLAALEEEEAAWASLQAKYMTSEQRSTIAEGAAPREQEPEATAAVQDEDIQASAVSNRTSVAAAAGASADGTEPAALTGTLEKTEQEVNFALSLQVESLSSFLSKVNALVAKGEQACMMLQADYHQEKFKTFPHVNSPAWLIRHIVGQHRDFLGQSPL